MLLSSVQSDLSTGLPARLNIQVKWELRPVPTPVRRPSLSAVSQGMLAAVTGVFMPDSGDQAI
jgi:hypothetical protein